MCTNKIDVTEIKFSIVLLGNPRYPSGQIFNIVVINVSDTQKWETRTSQNELCFNVWCKTRQPPAQKDVPGVLVLHADNALKLLGDINYFNPGAGWEPSPQDLLNEVAKKYGQNNNLSRTYMQGNW